MKKIMFNDKYGLTQAVLNGSKTQTRRIMKGKPLFPSDEIESTGVLGDEVQIIANGGESLITMKLPFRVGEIVAIAQSYKDIFSAFSQHPNPQLNIGVKNPTDTAGWTNKMFVKPSLMPHQIRITDVRVELLQDISDEDCLKEGITDMGAGGSLRYSFTENVKQTTGDTIAFSNNFAAAKEAFAHLINKVSKKGTWESNPYVFVYDFELVK